jgi:hypothetical protein
MTEHQENIGHARLSLVAVSLWLSILADTCGADAVAEMEAHLAAISRGLDRLDPPLSRGLC